MAKTQPKAKTAAKSSVAKATPKKTRTPKPDQVEAAAEADAPEAAVEPAGVLMTATATFECVAFEGRVIAGTNFRTTEDRATLHTEAGRAVRA